MFALLNKYKNINVFITLRVKAKDESKESFNVSSNIHNVNRTRKNLLLLYSMFPFAIVHSGIQSLGATELNCHLFNVFQRKYLALCAS